MGFCDTSLKSGSILLASTRKLGGRALTYWDLCAGRPVIVSRRRMSVTVRWSGRLPATGAIGRQSCGRSGFGGRGQGLVAALAGHGCREADARHDSGNRGNGTEGSNRLHYANGVELLESTVQIATVGHSACPSTEHRPDRYAISRSVHRPPSRAGRSEPTGRSRRRGWRRRGPRRTGRCSAGPRRGGPSRRWCC